MGPKEEIHDIIVVGAGPAGLTAAIYCGRFRRRCVVLEDAHSRARWIPTSHNIPGFTAGIGGEEYLARLNQQAMQFGAQLRRAHVSSLAIEEGIFRLYTDGAALSCRYVLLSTGVRDRLPPMEGAEDAVRRGVLRVCPICDGFEAIDRRIAIIGDGAAGEREAEFLRNYSDRVTLLELPSRHDRKACTPCSGGIERIRVTLSELKVKNDRVTLSTPQGERDFDVVYLALGCSPQHNLARSLNARCDERGALVVNGHQETSVPCLYAAGDVVRGLNQVVVAAAEGAIAAVDIHNKLRAT